MHDFGSFASRVRETEPVEHIAWGDRFPAPATVGGCLNAVATFPFRTWPAGQLFPGSERMAAAGLEPVAINKRREFWSQPWGGCVRGWWSQFQHNLYSTGLRPQCGVTTSQDEEHPVHEPYCDRSTGVRRYVRPTRNEINIHWSLEVGTV